MMVFTPIELGSPYWLQFRAVVMQGIPEHVELQFDHRDPSIMRFCLEWVDQILRLLPGGLHREFLARIDVVNEVLASAIPLERFQRFLMCLAKRETLHRVNMELHAIDCERERGGLPTFTQLISHHLGIEPAPGTVAMAIRVSHGFSAKPIEELDQSGD